MTKRISLNRQVPAAYQALLALLATVEAAAAQAGLDQKLIELVKLRCSQINGCAFCTDMHSRDALALGESERRLFLLPVWREADLYSDAERAALGLAEAMTRLPGSDGVPDEVYEAASAAFTDRQLAVIGWATTVINAFNRVAVTSQTALRNGPAAPG